jgi:hypothetical protein
MIGLLAGSGGFCGEFSSATAAAAATVLIVVAFV